MSAHLWHTASNIEDTYDNYPDESSLSYRQRGEKAEYSCVRCSAACASDEVFCPDCYDHLESKGYFVSE